MAPFASISSRFSAWYARESETANYDWFIRLPALLYFGVVLHAQAVAVGEAYANDTLAPALHVAAVVARTAALMVLVLFAALTLVRSRPVARSQGLTPRLAAIVGVAVLFGLAFLERAPPVLGFEIASAVMIAVSGLASCYVLLWLGRSFSTMPEARKLVTSGPYRFVRHPLYAAEELAVLGVLLQYRSAAALLLVAVQIALQLTRMRYEEGVLSRAFPEYGTYSASAARLIPGVY